MKKTKKKTYRLKSDQIPVTRKLLFGVRSELMTRHNSHDRRFDAISAQLGEINLRLDSIPSRFESLLKSLKDHVTAEIRKIAVISEDQNAKNLYVVDGITSHSHRLENVEKRMGSLERDWLQYRKKEI